MKYSNEIVVDLPRAEFIQKMDDPENMKHWQRGLMAYEQLSQTPGQEGSRMSLSYQMGKRKMEMVETIIKRKLPEEMHTTYDTKGVHNIQKNYFREENGKTRWISESEFQFSGFGMKLMGLLMPGAFKKQSLKYMEDFKNFAEKGISVLDQ
ncbi:MULTISPECIES: SRPBCC family protein [Flagellimonas]|uniref:SRPBCC family protein n=1 Tax=Flagellimonas hadalis TaxID=2597517 RepID=A0A5N5ITY4_9FLAO|nr:SRPBCC family protein [Allomuricauda hadalis]KAB5485270.1 SRPBCC family protein [Allomuricauda hadalis]RUA15337.1 MAG: SRPBCC family protein [Flavobacteriia bacterium]